MWVFGDQPAGDRSLRAICSRRTKSLVRVNSTRQPFSTIVTSQLPVEHWHENIGDPTVADAILDRLVHNAPRLTLKGESLRKAAAKRQKLDGESSN